MPDRRESFESAQIELLWEEFLGGSLAEDGAQTLLTWLETHPEQLATRQKDAGIHFGLAALLASEENSARLIDSVQARLSGSNAGATTGRFSKKVMSQIQRGGINRRAQRLTRSRARNDSGLWIAGAAAAALVIGIAVLFFMKPGAAPVAQTTTQLEIPMPQKPPPVQESSSLKVMAGQMTVDGASVGAGSTVPLKTGAAVQATAGARGEIRLGDGSTLKLCSESQISLLSSDHGYHLQLSAGQCDVRAARQLPGERLRIETAFSTAEVIGTEFTVQALPTQSWIAVQGGSVSVQATSDKKASNVLAGEEVTASSTGLGAVQKSLQKRMLALELGRSEMYADPVKLAPLSESFRNMPVESFSYRRPGKHDQFGYGGAVWPLTLRPGEGSFEVWLRPTRIEPMPREYNLLKICIIITLDHTQYITAAQEVRTADRDWVRVTGTLDGAKVHWTERGMQPEPLNPERIKQIVLRVDMGEADFIHTPITILPRAP